MFAIQSYKQFILDSYQQFKETHWRQHSISATAKIAKGVVNLCTFSYNPNHTSKVFTYLDKLVFSEAKSANETNREIILEIFKDDELSTLARDFATLFTDKLLLSAWQKGKTWYDEWVNQFKIENKKQVEEILETSLLEMFSSFAVQIEKIQDGMLFEFSQTIEKIYCEILPTDRSDQSRFETLQKETQLVPKTQNSFVFIQDVLLNTANSSALREEEKRELFLEVLELIDEARIPEFSKEGSKKLCEESIELLREQLNQWLIFRKEDPYVKLWMVLFSGFCGLKNEVHTALSKKTKKERDDSLKRVCEERAHLILEFPFPTQQRDLALPWKPLSSWVIDKKLKKVEKKLGEYLFLFFSNAHDFGNKEKNLSLLHNTFTGLYAESSASFLGERFFKKLYGNKIERIDIKIQRLVRGIDRSNWISPHRFPSVFRSIKDFLRSKNSQLIQEVLLEGGSIFEELFLHMWTAAAKKSFPDGLPETVKKSFYKTVVRQLSVILNRNFWTLIEEIRNATDEQFYDFEQQKRWLSSLTNDLFEFFDLSESLLPLPPGECRKNEFIDLKDEIEIFLQRMIFGGRKMTIATLFCFNIFLAFTITFLKISDDIHSIVNTMIKTTGGKSLLATKQKIDAYGEKIFLSVFI